MLTEEEDVEAHHLRNRGWSISAIARHLGRDRKTIRAYPGFRSSWVNGWGVCSGGDWDLGLLGRV